MLDQGNFFKCPSLIPTHIQPTRPNMRNPDESTTLMDLILTNKPKLLCLCCPLS